MTYRQVFRTVKKYLNVQTDPADVKAIEETLPTLPLDDVRKAFINSGDEYHHDTYESGAGLETMDDCLKTLTEQRLVNIYEQALCTNQVLDYEDEDSNITRKNALPSDALVQEVVGKIHDRDSMHETYRDLYLQRLAGAYLDDVLNPVGKKLVLDLFADKDMGPEFKGEYVPNAIIHAASPDTFPLLSLTKDSEIKEAFEVFLTNQIVERPHLKDVIFEIDPHTLMEKFQDMHGVMTDLKRVERSMRKGLSNDEM